jgi:hypothetical protein
MSPWVRTLRVAPLLGSVVATASAWPVPRRSAPWRAAGVREAKSRACPRRGAGERSGDAWRACSRGLYREERQEDDEVWPVCTNQWLAGLDSP